MTKPTLLMCLMVCLSFAGAGAQTAKVQELTPAETQQIKALYAQQDAVAQHIADFRAAMDRKYLRVSEPVANSHLYHPGHYKDGWFFGFEFSEDFRFIVPKQEAHVTPYWGSAVFSTQ